MQMPDLKFFAMIAYAKINRKEIKEAMLETQDKIDAEMGIGHTADGLETCVFEKPSQSNNAPKRSKLTTCKPTKSIEKTITSRNK